MSTRPRPKPRLVSDDVAGRVGAEVTYRAPEPLGAASIRHYALAVGADPDRWADEAPPTLVCDTAQLTGNRSPDVDGYLGHTWDLPFPEPTTMIRGGNDYTFHQPVRAGDRIVTVWRLDAVVERTDAAGRPMAIVTTTATYRRQDGTALATNVETLIHRATGGDTGPDGDTGPGGADADRGVEAASADSTGSDIGSEGSAGAGVPSVGDRLPDLVRTLGPADLMAYGAATWDWHRLHHDAGWAAAAGFDRPVVDGQMLGALLAQQVLDWAPPGAGLARLQFRNRAPVLAGSTVVCTGVVTDVAGEEPGERSVTIDLEIRVGGGVDGEIVVATGQAVLALERVAPPRARLHHAHLFAADLDASIEFYRRWFGAEVLGDEVFAGSRNVLLAVGDGRLNFYDQPPRDRGHNAVHHLGIQTDDLTAVVERMRAGGVAFRKPITDVDRLRYVMVEGPDGVLIELFEADAADHRDGTARWFAW